MGSSPAVGAGTAAPRLVPGPSMRAFAATLLVIAAAPAMAGAAPLRPPRNVPAARAATSTEPARLAPRTGLVRACGSRLESTTDAILEHESRPLAAPLATPFSTDAGDIAVLEDDGRFFYTDKNNNPLVDIASVA